MNIPVVMIARMGFRNLLRYRRRNAMLCISVAVGVATMLFAGALMRGMQAGMTEDAIDGLVGNLKITTTRYLQDPTAEHGFAMPPGLAQRLDAGNVQWTSRIVLPVVIQSERETRGVQLAGIDPADEAGMSFLRKAVIEGARLTGPEDRGLLIGTELARRLETGVGKRVVISVQDVTGHNRETGFRICGLYDVEGTGMETVFAFTGRAYLQQLLNDPGLRTEVSLRLATEADTSTWYRALVNRLPDLHVSRWQDLLPQVAALVQFAGAGILIWYVILLSALAFGVANTFIAAVLERTREIGLMQVLGMQSSSIVLQVVIESLWIMVAGLVLGLAVGVLAVWWIRDGIDLSQFAQGTQMFGLRSMIKPVLLGGDVVRTVETLAAFGVVAALYPAWKAVRINALDALRRSV